jgi:hypothetical protein
MIHILNAICCALNFGLNIYSSLRMRRVKRNRTITSIVLLFVAVIVSCLQTERIIKEVRSSPKVDFLQKSSHK